MDKKTRNILIGGAVAATGAAIYVFTKKRKEKENQNHRPKTPQMVLEAIQQLFMVVLIPMQIIITLTLQIQTILVPIIKGVQM